MIRLFRAIAAFAAFGATAVAQPYIITTIAGANRVLDGSPAASVPLREPLSTAADVSGGVYIADALDNRIRHINAQGIIATIAGTGAPGYSGDRGKAAAAQLSNPHGVVLDGNGNIYIADYGNNRVRRVAPDGTINTIAGNGSPLYTTGGQASSSGLSPLSLAVDSRGTTLYIADDFAFKILKMDLVSGNIAAIAGTGTLADPTSGETGPALSCRIGLVTGMALDAAGNLYLADATDARVRKLDAKGNLTTAAGAGTYGTISDGLPAAGAVMLPLSVAFDANGNLLIADYNRDLIFRVGLDGLIRTFAGNGLTGYSGDNGPAAGAELNAPRGLAVSPSDGSVYFADQGNSRVRRIYGGAISTLAGAGIRDGGPASSAFLSVPFGVAVDGSGRMAISDSENYEVRALTAAGNINPIGQLNGAAPLAAAVDGGGNFYITDDEPAVLKISPGGATATVAGNGKDGYTGDGGSAASASISGDSGVAVDAFGNVYITDYNNNRVRKITAAGTISTVAGNGNPRASGDNGPATAAGVNPFDIAVDSRQNIYIADRGNDRVRRIAPDGTISTVAGTGHPGYSGDGGPATSASLAGPSGVAVDSAGNLYICDRDNGVVRRVTAGGLITTIAGNGQVMPAGGDGGLAANAQLDPWRVAVDSGGNIYVADLLNDRVRKLTPKIVTVSAIKITGGNNQSGNTGALLPSSLAIQVVDSTGAGVPGVIVTFAATPAGAATLSPATAITLNDGSAVATATLGKVAATITVTASAAGVAASASFSFTITNPVSPTAPAIAAGGIVGAALSHPAIQTLSQNGIATVFGVNFAPPGAGSQIGSADLVNGQVPVLFAGVCVQVGSRRAPIFAVYPNQINFQVPANAGANATVQVTTNCDAAGAQTSNAAPVTMQSTAPEFFYFVLNPDGHNPIAAINAATGAYVGVPGTTSGASFTPAQPGDILTLFGTGFGATTPAFQPGDLPAATASVDAAVTVSFGGIAVDAADILYAGVVPGNAGLYQLNVRVPDAVPTGDQAVIVTIGGIASPANAYIRVGQ